jgi:hypothetical protein
MHIDGSFDMENAPAARGYFLGDYQGLTAIGQDFLASYSQKSEHCQAPRWSPVSAGAHGH